MPVERDYMLERTVEPSTDAPLKKRSYTNRIFDDSSSRYSGGRLKLYRPQKVIISR